MKNALVLGGGGSLGAYTIGAIKALNELGYKYQILTGTSVGALISSLLAVNKFDLLLDTWKNIDYKNVFDYEYKMKNKSLETFFVGLFTKGMDIKPLIELLKENITYKEIQESNIDVGIVYTTNPRKYTPIKLKEVKEENFYNSIIASCSATPFFRKIEIDGIKCYDGVYSDNLPVKLAKEMGASKIIAIDVLKGIRKKVDTSDIKYLYIKPSKKMGFFLDFNNRKINELLELGYNDIINNKDKILDFINN